MEVKGRWYWVKLNPPSAIASVCTLQTNSPDVSRFLETLPLMDKAIHLRPMEDVEGDAYWLWLKQHSDYRKLAWRVCWWVFIRNVIRLFKGQ